MNIALPSIGNELHMDAFTLGWVSTGFLLSSAIFMVPFGKAADIYGRKKIFIIGLLLFVLMSFPLYFSNSAGMLIALRIIQGIGGSMFLGSMVAIIASVFQIGERGTAMGITAMATSIGITSGPFLGGLLTQYLGWRSIFLVNVPLGLLIVALVLWKIKIEWRDAKGDTFDYKGSIVFGLILTSVLYGITTLPSLEGALLIGVGCLALPVFVIVEKKTKAPILNIELFNRNNRGFVFSNLAALIFYSATFAINYTLSLYLQYSKGYTPFNAGLILVVQSVFTIIFSPLAGRLTDKYGARLIASIGMSVTVLATSLLILVDSLMGIEFLIVDLALLGTGTAFFNGPNQYAIMSSVERRLLGVASGMLGIMRQIGQVLSMGIATIAITLIVGRGQIVPELYPAFITSAKIIFIIFAILCAIGIVASIVRGKI